MPELPEVETVRRALEAVLPTRRLASVTVREIRLRHPVDRATVQALIGMRIEGVRRRAKYLLIDLSASPESATVATPAAIAAAPRWVLLVHLGMSGRLQLVDAATAPAADRHVHAVFTLDHGLELRFRDPRRFGWLDAFHREREARHPRLVTLGREPLTPEFTGAWLHRRTRKRGKPIKGFLMDATHIVGIGNIYACEALHAARIHPDTKSGTLSIERCDRLVAAIQQTMTLAIEHRGTTLRDFADPSGQAGSFSGALRVYGREGQSCERCRTRTIRRLRHGGRSTFLCPGCQH